MKALLLAGGLGTRLRPVTDFIPKCLVPVHGKPLLDYWLENLSAAGVDEFLINTSYLAEQVLAWKEKSSFCEQITLVHEEQLLNTGGTLLQNQNFFDEEAFFLIHADNLSFCDFQAFVNAHKTRPKICEITMMTFKTDTPSSCGIVELDEKEIVQHFFEKVENPPSNLANGAVYICEPTLFPFLKSLHKKNIDFSLDVLPHFMGKIYTYENRVYHRDIGTVESYALAQIEYLYV
ncbi:nucleotidyltransferase family protein [Sulfurimonas sp. NWX367]|uniref:nucleotidyltransferase family protein n=1 Tax=unclassified Sulfurimonas TaxID=2623549 RepID=UPI00320473F6